MLIELSVEHVKEIDKALEVRILAYHEKIQDLEKVGLDPKQLKKRLEELKACHQAVQDAKVL